MIFIQSSHLVMKLRQDIQPKTLYQYSRKLQSHQSLALVLANISLTTAWLLQVLLLLCTTISPSVSQVKEWVFHHFETLEITKTILSQEVSLLDRDLSIKPLNQPIAPAPPVSTEAPAQPMPAFRSTEGSSSTKEVPTTAADTSESTSMLLAFSMSLACHITCQFISNDFIYTWVFWIIHVCKNHLLRMIYWHSNWF